MKIQSLLVVSIICFLCMGASAKAEDAVTGLCKDGTSYTGVSKKGACRGHKGIKEWYADKETPAAKEQSPAKSATVAAEKEEKTPAASASGPATGICKDGTPYTGTSKKGACRGHKGIKEWYADKQAPAAAEITPAAKEEPSAKAAPAASTASEGVATGLCKDGTEYTGASKRGACRGHKGIKEWYADKQPTAAKDEAPAATAPAAPTKSESTAPAPVAGSGKVWVNTKSKIYHCEGSKFYGNTKEGEYMSEADAQAKGYNPNRKKVCH
jgi:hypothetical protein